MLKNAIFPTLLVSFALSHISYAVGLADPVGPEDFTLGQTDISAPSGGLRFEFASEVDFENTAANFSTERVFLDVPLGGVFPLNSSNSISAGLRYQGTWVDSSIGDFDLHDIRLAVTWLHRSSGSKWSWIGEVAPGLMSDFNSINGDDVSINWLLGVRCQVSDKFAWVAGAGSDPSTGDTSVVPTIGFQWLATDDIYVSLIGATFTATWQPCDDWLLRVGAWASGGVWNVDVAGNSLNLNLTSYRAGVGIEHRLKDNMWLTLWAGATLANKVEVETSGGSRIFSDDAEDGWFVNLGLRVAAW